MTSAKKNKILIIDNEPAMTMMVTMYLENNGFEVETARGSVIANKKILSKDYDVILTDLNLPRSDDMDFYEEIRMREPSTAKKFIFMTESNTTSWLKKVEEGKQPLLHKPFKLKSLMRAIKSIT
ncbi:MAG: response regulator [Deltaproteobacteria bacterium]|nr:response regulator [Deltaproteobacteria bacterium]